MQEDRRNAAETDEDGGGGNDEDFEIDHETCPHCGSEVIVFEYSYPGDKDVKEEKEIICPKCQKVICTRNNAWYYRTELFEHDKE